jgi:hypothetical protein
MDRFENLGVIKNTPDFDNTELNQFENSIRQLKTNLSWTKKQIVEQFFKIIPNFDYQDKGKYLDGKM